MKKKEENIEQLISLFADKAQGLRIVREVEQAEVLLAASCQLQPSAAALEAVKQKVKDRLAGRQRHKLYARFWVGAAACATLAALAGLMYFDNMKNPAAPSAAGGNINGLSAIWSESDAAMATLMQQIETIADELEAGGLKWGQTEGVHSRLTSEVENLELVATNLDFWKG